MQITSNSITLKNLQRNDFEGLSQSVGNSPKDILDRTPIAVLAKFEGIAERAEIFLAKELNNLHKSLNIAENLNMQPWQIPQLAEQLLLMFPVETLEDFVLCFRRGSLGFYGKIFRLDAAVINEWMQKYLEEKYTYVEAKVQEQQDQTLKDNEVNYEAFKKRVGEVFKEEKKTNFKENEYQRWKLEQGPYMYYPVRGVEIYATSQEHAEEIVRKLIALGELEEVRK
jgi:polyhydroxyalkanoate synthesis regulator phasin